MQGKRTLQRTSAPRTFALCCWPSLRQGGRRGKLPPLIIRRSRQRRDTPMIRNTMLAMTTFVLIACAQSASVEASDHINLLPHPYFPPALSAKLQTASANPLEGKLLRYLIGTDGPVSGSHDTVIEVAYDVGRPPAKGMAIAYCNLFDEENTGKYAPYLQRRTPPSNIAKVRSIPRGRVGRKICASSSSAGSVRGSPNRARQPRCLCRGGCARRDRSCGHLRPQGHRQESRPHGRR